MSDLIDRQAAIDKIREVYEYEFPTASGAFDEFVTVIIPNLLRNLPSAQPDVHDRNVGDMISRQDVLALAKDVILINGAKHRCIDATQIHELPSAQPTLYGYSIEHLALIAIIMQKENVTPEKALEYFKDIQRMGQMIIDEQQEIIKRTVEKWTI